MVRQVNQDYVYVTDRPLGILQNLFVVADGMGGHQAGDYASKYTVEVLNRELALSEGEDIERCLVGAIKTANREIIKEASRDEHLKGMGTTVVAATTVITALRCFRFTYHLTWQHFTTADPNLYSQTSISSRCFFMRIVNIRT